VKGGTTFHFVTEGIDSTLGGPKTLRAAKT
jgi:hypothetical protein